MADDTQITGTTAAGLATPPEPTLTQDTSTEAAAETPVQPKYVTEEALEQKATEIIRRMKQSDKDRMKQIDTKLSDIKARLESGGAQLNASQVNVLREQIEQEVDSGVQAQAPASALTPEMQAQADFVYSQIDAAFEDVGTSVTANDPEWKLIKDALDDPKGSLAKAIRAASKAAETKAQRLASQKNNAAARAVSAGGAQSNTTQTLSPEQKISKGLSGNWSESRR